MAKTDTSKSLGLAFATVIETRKLPATDTKGARIVVTCEDVTQKNRRKVFPYDHSAENAHYSAAVQYAELIGMDPAFKMKGGQTAGGYAFVMVRR
jgi:hypothetical protein